MPPTVIPSTPALPLFAFTRCNASFRFSRSHTSSINRFVLTGLSGSFAVESDSVSSLPASRGFTRRRGREVQFFLNILLHVAPEIHVLIDSPLVRAFNHRSRLGLSVDSAFRHRSASL